MSEIIARAAEKLAIDSLIMNSYEAFYKGEGYFLTKNSNLHGTSPSFPINSKVFMNSWGDYTNAQRSYLAILAELEVNKVKAEHYKKIKRAYEKWDFKYSVAVYGSFARWACNLFVGEALFMAGKNYVNDSLKYYSALQIWKAEGPFKLIDKKT